MYAGYERYRAARKYNKSRPLRFSKYDPETCKKHGYHSTVALYVRLTETVEDEDAKKKGAYWTPTKQKNKWERIGEFCTRCHETFVKTPTKFTKEELEARKKIPGIYDN